MNAPFNIYIDTRLNRFMSILFVHESSLHFAKFYFWDNHLIEISFSMREKKTIEPYFLKIEFSQFKTIFEEKTSKKMYSSVLEFLSYIQSFEK